MNLLLNGEKQTMAAGITIGQLLNQLHLQTDRVVLELNHTILNATDNVDTQLHDGDRLEIIQFVGGG